MGINVCIKVIKATAEISGDESTVLFTGKVKMLVVDEDSKTVKEVEWYLGDIDQVGRAADYVGKVGYAVVEKVEGIPKVWFLDKSPFEDEWREELLWA